MIDSDKSLKLLKEIKLILDQEKIFFWLEAGTLLGAIKYKGIIPWDTDIDLGAFKKYFSESTKRKLTKVFGKKGFDIYFFPEKIDIIKNGSTAIQIHLAYGPKKNYFVRQMADNREESGETLYKIYRLSNVSYYGRFKSCTSRANIKTDLFKLITYLPKSMKKKVSSIVMAKLTKLKHSGIYYINIPKSYFSKFKKINFYGISFNVPMSYEKYLEKQYGNWRGPPPKEPEKWVWHEHGEWKKIYKKEEISI